ncbi:MAG: hypothetical protein H5T97_12535 [Firmicutes bacterium]|nr:hypothetical protein [Bacillota bacterium]
MRTKVCSFSQAAEAICALVRAGRSALAVGPRASGKTALLEAVRGKLEAEGIAAEFARGWEAPPRLGRLSLGGGGSAAIVDDGPSLKGILGFAERGGAVLAALEGFGSLEELRADPLFEAAAGRFAAAAILERRGAFSEPSVLLAEW